jgi:hypothetical protein
MPFGFIRMAMALTLVLSFSVSELQARDMDGKLGIGYGQGLSQTGVSGLAIEYWVGYVKIGALVGFDMWVPDQGEGTTEVKAAVHVLYAVARARNANLNIGIRGNAGFQLFGDEEATGFGIELPIEAEYWLAEHVSLTGHVGLTIDLLDGEANPLLAESTAGEGIRLGLGAAGFAGGVGFRFYF